LSSCGLKEMFGCSAEWGEHRGVEAKGEFVEGCGLGADEVRRAR
jgi:hypothetical protein